MAAASTEEQFAALTLQMSQLFSEHQRIMADNAALTAEVQRLGVVVNFGPPAKEARAGDAADQPVDFKRGATFGVLKTPLYGKQCCPVALQARQRSVSRTTPSG